jgi:phosphoribosyl 1,2-cyclic phosphodiesterase
MAVRIAVLASGSRGNCAVLSSSKGSVLVDAGLSCRETLRRMKDVGEEPRRLQGIVISHEHADHVVGIQILAKKLKIPVYMTAATYESWSRSTRDDEGKPARLERCEHFQAGQGFSIGDIDINPFTIPHDAADPCGFTFSTEGIKIGMVTDLGYLPNNVKHHLRGSNGLLIESNHDLEMLRNGPYPWMVKQRVMSRVGHLSNSALAEFLSTDYDGAAAFVVLLHLSEQNNNRALAHDMARKGLNNRCNLFQAETPVLVAEQDKHLQPLCLG